MMEPATVEDATHIKLGPVGTVVFGAILVGVGFLFAFVLERSAMKDGSASDDWPSVVGRITSSKVTEYGPRSDRDYRPQVKYEYSVDDKKYTSDRINFASQRLQSPSRLQMESFVDQYRKGSPVDVYYNPEAPSISCLETGARLGVAFFVGLGCIGLGALIVVSGSVAAIRKLIS